MSTRLAVLDLGSNSFHALVADLADGRLHTVAREREMLHLSRVLATHRRLPAEVRRRALATAAHLGEVARRAGASDPVAVATAALRELEDGAAVLDELAEAAGMPVRVLSGDEEARLAHLGARSAVAVAEGPVLVLDLGGGSLELAVGDGPHAPLTVSLPLGASRLSALLTTDPPAASDLALLREQVAATLAPGRDRLRAQGPATAVAVGGTVRALARVEAAGGWAPPTVNMSVLTLARLRRLRDRLSSLTDEGRRAVPGMKARRADHIHVAAVVLVEVLEQLELDRLTVSDWGLREGLLLDAHGLSRPPGPAALRDAEVDRLRHALLPDADLRPHVATLATRLFDATRALHRLDAGDRALLAHAARLMDVGRALALRRHHQHGAYLVEQGELKGFAPDELAVLVTLVRFHVSRGVDPRYPPFAHLAPADRSRVERLLPLLQLADGLDRPRDGVVTDLVARRRDGRLQLALLGREGALARVEVGRRGRLFTSTFGVDVEVVDRIGP